MSIEWQVLGNPARDNAVFVRVNSRNAIHRLQFDCGDSCLSSLNLSDIQLIDHLFFSHLHMDHVAGFDAFLRATFNRVTKPNAIWGPADTARILHHRFQGYQWNLTHDLTATWHLHDVMDNAILTWHTSAATAFASFTEEESVVNTNPLVDVGPFTVQALIMDHITPSLAYIVREKPRYNIDMERLAKMNLPTGPWLKLLKEPSSNEPTSISINSHEYPLAQLRADLLVATAGESFAYLTDFLLDDVAQQRLIPFIAGCSTVVCECQYTNADVELAQRHHHMTPNVVATLAKKAQIGQLVLFHVSERYHPSEWLGMLADAQAIFPNTRFPDHWNITIDVP